MRGYGSIFSVFTLLGALSLQGCFQVGKGSSSTGSPSGTSSPVSSSEPSFSMHLKFFIEGYYDEVSGQMRSALKNQNASSDASLTDHITVELHSAQAPYAMLKSIGADLKTDGTVSVSVPIQFSGESVYLAIKHRNALETWTAHAFPIAEGFSYDFSTSKSQAFGSNQKLVDPGVYAFFSGDLNGDGYVDASDCSKVDDDVRAFASGNLSSELTGDGNVDLYDNAVCDRNNLDGIASVLP